MIIICPLLLFDVSDWVALRKSQSEEYCAYFTPFSFEPAVLEKLLREAREDIFMGVWVEESLAGFFMLRGPDSGYPNYMYGVLVGEDFSGRGLGHCTLAVAKAICLLNSADLLLKVHPKNTRAIHLYESEGFVQIGISATHDLIYQYQKGMDHAR